MSSWHTDISPDWDSTEQPWWAWRSPTDTLCQLVGGHFEKEQGPLSSKSVQERWLHPPHSCDTWRVIHFYCQPRLLFFSTNIMSHAKHPHEGVARLLLLILLNAKTQLTTNLKSTEAHTKTLSHIWNSMKTSTENSPLIQNLLSTPMYPYQTFVLKHCLFFSLSWLYQFC